MNRRHRAALGVAAIAIVAGLVGACASRPKPATTAQTQAEAERSGGVGAAVRRGASDVGRGLGDAVTAPLEDLNLKREPIPPVLTRAVANPYDLTNMTRCEPIAAEVGSLDDALGPDLDEPPPPDNRTRAQKGADMASNATLDAVRGASTDIIPFRGWVRRLTGAQRHQKAVQDAIRAGQVRRAYLKGVGMRMNCAPPAAPSWFEPAPPPPPPTTARAPTQRRPAATRPSTTRPVTTAPNPARRPAARPAPRPPG